MKLQKRENYISSNLFLTEQGFLLSNADMLLIPIKIQFWFLKKKNVTKTTGASPRCRSVAPTSSMRHRNPMCMQLAALRGASQALGTRSKYLENASSPPGKKTCESLGINGSHHPPLIVENNKWKQWKRKHVFEPTRCRSSWTAGGRKRSVNLAGVKKTPKSYSFTSIRFDKEVMYGYVWLLCKIHLIPSNPINQNHKI